MSTSDKGIYKVKLKYLLTLAISLLFLSACSEDKNTVPVEKNKKGVVERNLTPKDYSAGQRLYQLNCASCHGQQGEGAKDWRTPDKEGKNQPPPLNGSGHTWHHSPKALVTVIKNGTGKIGGNMPAWKDKFSDSEITLILNWITAQWPDEIYTAWYNQHHQQN
ncbi:MAG: c-type cytochrome [Gammaproteobacteria bacterium]|nr:c-type cytochrome [Gammaproteobacteria bacterium]MCW9029985.1 c-type cytochrome [Gammaproteobacteria bacterium]